MPSKHSGPGTSAEFPRKEVGELLFPRPAGEIKKPCAA